MNFAPHTQDELKKMQIIAGKSYTIEYLNKDYYNGEETLEKGMGVALISEDKIYFNATDPYGMDRLVMKARVL